MIAANATTTSRLGPSGSLIKKNTVLESTSDAMPKSMYFILSYNFGQPVKATGPGVEGFLMEGIFRRDRGQRHCGLRAQALERDLKCRILARRMLSPRIVHH